MLSVEEYKSDEFERILLEYADDCSNEGKTLDMGNTLLSAVKALYPRYSRTGDLTLRRFSRALQGWHQLMPGQSRWPIPWPMVAAAAVWLAKRNYMAEALGMIMQFSAYLRPGELLSLRVMDLVPPPLKYWKARGGRSPDKDEHVRRLGHLGQPVFGGLREVVHGALEHVAQGTWQPVRETVAVRADALRSVGEDVARGGGRRRLRRGGLFD